MLVLVFLSFVFIEGKWIPFDGTKEPQKPSVRCLTKSLVDVTLEAEVKGVDYKVIKTDFMENSTGETFALLRLPGYAYTGEIGKPKMPMLTGVIEVPHEAELKIEVIDAEYKEISLEDLGIPYRIMPALASVPKIKGARPVFVLDEKTYSTNEYYPGKLVDLMHHEGFARGHRIVTVCFYPIQYNPVTDKIKVYTKIVARVVSIGGDLQKTEEMIKKHYSPAWEHFMKRMILNYVERKDVAPVPIYYDIFYKGEGKVIADLLASWKKKKGFKVRMWDASGWTASQIDDTIEAQTPIATYLVIIGDPNSSTIGLPASAVGDSSGDQTDLYYAEVDGVGYLPDMFYGRISVNDTIEGKIAVNKIIQWEHADFGAQGTDWLKRALFIAGYDANFQNVGIATNAYCRQLLINNGYAVADVDTFIYASGEEEGRIVSEINDTGIAFCVYTAHGDKDQWAIGYSSDFNVTELTNLTTNVNRYPMAIGHCCLTGDFEDANVTQCFGETWAKLDKHGGVSYFGSVVPTYWDEDDWLQRREFDAMFTDSVPGRLYEVGRWTQWGLYWIENNTSSSRKQYYFEAYHIFNEPSMDMWTDIPDTLQVIHDNFVAPGPGTFTVTVKDNDGVTPIEDALVCVWIYTQTPELHEADYTDATGTVTFNINPQNVGDTMWITVTKHNYYPYEGFAIVSGAPSKPTILKVFNNARVFDPTPEVQFYSTDNEGDDIEYKIYWDTSSIFSTPESSITSLYPSGDTVTFSFPTLSHNVTYWWKVRARDPAGSGCWSPWSEVRCFVVDTTLPESTCAWTQCSGEQFSENTFTGGTYVEGDSVVLSQTITNRIVLIDENFESGSLPTGWTITDGDNDGYTWNITTTGQSDLGGYDPPSAGSYYAYYSDDDAGRNNSTADEYLTAPAKYIGDAVQCSLYYGWGFRLYQTGEQLTAEVRFHDGISWGTWTVVATHNATGSGNSKIDLSTYLPAESVQVRWHYTDGGNWGWAAAVDNIKLVKWYKITNTEGSMITLGVYYKDLSRTYNKPRPFGWGYLIWEKSSADDSIKVQIEYRQNGVWQLISDTDLPGNSSGFFTNQIRGEVDLRALDTLTYDSLRCIVTIYRPSTKASTDPALKLITLGSPTGGALPTSSKPTYTFWMGHPMPNPFKGSMVIKYSIGRKSDVEIKIYDITGRVVRNLLDSKLSPGIYTIKWDGKDNKGKKCATGIYFLKLNTKDFEATRKVILIK